MAPGTLILALSLSVTALQQQGPAPEAQGAVVWGQVRSEKSGVPLRMAIVELRAPGGITVLNAATDTNGVYVLRGVPHGRQVVRAMHIDHAPHEIEILVVADRQIYDFDLELRPVRLPVVNARVDRGVPQLRDTLAMAAPEFSAANARALEASPGVAELGLVEAARDAPGDPVDPSDVLFVRGSAADLKLVLLNGAPVYSPYHIGGLMHALDVDVLRSATLYLGGAPARYDGGLSYVMDLESRSGRTGAPHASVGGDLLTANASVEGPIGSRISYLAAGRAVHGYGTDAFFVGNLPYGYTDGLARVDLAIGDSAALSLSGFWNRESVVLDSIVDFEQVADWGNDAWSARYRTTFRGTAALLTVAGGQFQTGLPLGGVRPLLTSGTSERSRFTADFERAVGPARVFYGASHDRLGFEYRATTQGFDGDSLLVRSRADGSVTGGYIDGSVNLYNRVRLRGGLRADHFSLHPGVRLAPRVAATLLINERATLTLAGGQYRQYVRHPGRGLVFLGSPLPPDSAGEPPLTVAEATHFTLSLGQDLGEGVRLGLEGYYKLYEGLPSTQAGEAEASGMDVWVRRSQGRFRGWVSYSLGWVWSMRDANPRPVQSFAGRHLVSTGVAGPIPGGGVFDVRVSYGAGLPYTAIPEAEASQAVFSTALLRVRPQFDEVPGTPQAPDDPDQPYLRVDAELERTWRARVGTFQFALTPYVKVLNALNRRDALFYRFDREVGASEPLAGLPVLPLVGLEWSF